MSDGRLLQQNRCRYIKRGSDCQKVGVSSKTAGMGLILLIIIILLLIGAFPTGGYGFGYRSHGLLGTILIIILILWLLGRI